MSLEDRRPSKCYVVKCRSPQASTYVVEGKNLSEEDGDGASSDGEDGRADERGSTSSGDGDLRDGGVGGRRRVVSGLSRRRRDRVVGRDLRHLRLLRVLRLLGHLRLLGVLRLLRHLRLLGVLGLLRHLGLLRVLRLLGRLGVVSGHRAHGGGDSNRLGGDDGAVLRAVRDLRATVGDGVDDRGVDSGGGHGNGAGDDLGGLRRAVSDGGLALGDSDHLGGVVSGGGHGRRRVVVGGSGDRADHDSSSNGETHDD